MTSITAINSSAVNSTTDREDLKDNIAQVFNLLTGSKKTGASLVNDKVSEEVLYGAVVLQKLKQENPSIANQIIKELPKKFAKDLKDGKDQPVFRAVNEILDNARKKGTITSSYCKNIQNYAFGKSQLDDNTAALTRKVLHLGSTEKSNIEAILDRVDYNSSASSSDVKSFRSNLEKNIDLTPAQAATRRKLLMEDALGGMGTLAPNSTTELTPAAPTETDPTEQTTYPNELAFLPNPSDGKLRVLLPTFLSSDVYKVTLINENGSEGKNLYKVGTDPDGRANWVYDDTASNMNLSETVYINLRLKNGDWYNYAVKSNEVYKQSFAA